jgi:hypothetical protein
MPVTKLLPAGDSEASEAWVTRMENGIGDADSAKVDASEIETAIKYISSLDPEMARLFMNH